MRAGAIALMALVPIARDDTDDKVNTVTPTSVPPGGSGNTTSTMTNIRFAHLQILMCIDSGAPTGAFSACAASQ